MLLLKVVGEAYTPAGTHALHSARHHQKSAVVCILLPLALVVHRNSSSAVVCITKIIQIISKFDERKKKR